MPEPAECQVPGCQERGALHPTAYVTDPVGVTDHVWLCAKHDEDPGPTTSSSSAISRTDLETRAQGAATQWSRPST
jgi:hypothetical protein